MFHFFLLGAQAGFYNPWIQPVAVFDIDDRHEALHHAFFNAVHFFRNSESACTGTLISRQHLLTAAHCFGAGPATVVYLFLDGHFSEYSGIQKVWLAKDFCGSSCWSEDGVKHLPSDWAIIQLRAPVSKVYPVLEIATPEELVKGQSAMLVGFPTDRLNEETGLVPRTVDDQCHILDVLGEVILHDCASNQGNSGGPLLVQTPQGWKIAGVHSSAASSPIHKLVLLKTATRDTANKAQNMTPFAAGLKVLIEKSREIKGASRNEKELNL